MSVALAVIAWLVLFGPQLVQGRVCTLGDASSFRPFAEFSRERWRTARVHTYWNPYTFMGVESVASLSDSRPQYLPGPLLDAVESVSQPARAPQFWLLLAHLAGTLSVMALARRLWRVRGPAALCAGLVWLFAVPILLPFAYGHDAQLLSDALLPVAALFAHRVVAETTGRRKWLDTAALSAALGLQVLHGHPQIAVYGWTFVAAFAVQQALARRAARRLAWVLAGMALGAGIAAAVGWPALLFSSHSFRGGGLTAGLSLLEVDKFSLGWRDLASLAWPRAVGFGGETYWGALERTDYSPYLGAAAIALAARGIAGRRQDRSTVLFLASTAAASVLLSLGTTLGPAYGLARDVIPLWSKFRVPFYVLVIGLLALALLTARGVSAAIAPSRAGGGFKERAWLAALAPGVPLGLALLYGPLARACAQIALRLKPALAASAAEASTRAAGADLLLRVGLVALALVAIVLARTRRGAAVVWALPLLVAVDAGTISWPAVHRSLGPLAAIRAPRPTPLAGAAAADPLHRAYVGVPGPYRGTQYEEAYTNFWVSWRARCLTGLAGAPPAIWRHVMAYDLTRHAPALRAWGVGFMDLPSSISPDTSLMRPIRTEGGVTVHAFGRAPGRAYAVARVVGVPDEQTAAAAMAEQAFEPLRVAVTVGREAAGDYPGSESCAIRWLRDEPEHLAIETRAPDRAFVVLADSYFPGWEATIDDRPVRIAQTNLLVRGVAVPAGRHRIDMRYRTVGMVAGVTTTRLSGAALIVLVAVGLVAGRRRPARRAT